LLADEDKEDEEAMNVRTILIFLNMIFIISMDTQTFAFVHCIFSTQSAWEFFVLCFTTQVGLQFGTVCPNMSTNINVNFHTRGDGLISYNAMLNQIFIPWTGRKITSLLFSNVMISQMMKTKKLKF
jgi:hypothetical protein